MEAGIVGRYSKKCDCMISIRQDATVVHQQHATAVLLSVSTHQHAIVYSSDNTLLYSCMSTLLSSINSILLLYCTAPTRYCADCINRLLLKSIHCARLYIASTRYC